MKVLLAAALLSASAVLPTAAVNTWGVPATVHYIPYDKVSSVMAKCGSIIQDPGLNVLAQRRGAGQPPLGVELHHKTNHVFIMVDGEATFVTGGTLVGAKQTGPDQTRGERIEGGQTFHLKKGDVVTVPAGTPHWWKEVPTGTVGYYGVNIEGPK